MFYPPPPVPSVCVTFDDGCRYTFRQTHSKAYRDMRTRAPYNPHIIYTRIKHAQVVKHCRQRNNFNTVFEIMCGLNHFSVYRLKLANDLADTHAQLLQDHLAFTSASQNYAAYRLVRPLFTRSPTCRTHAHTYTHIHTHTHAHTLTPSPLLSLTPSH